jgi:heme-degrading monooxygenase HmoA
MYATIRRYTSKDPSKAKAAFTSLKDRIESKFVPMLHDVPGFHGYYVLNANDRELVTVSIFESRAGADESTRRAAEFVRNDPLQDQLGQPEIIEGDLIVTKEAPVGTH